jgi:hypothetical protein
MPESPSHSLIRPVAHSRTGVKEGAASKIQPGSMTSEKKYYREIAILICYFSIFIVKMPILP